MKRFYERVEAVGEEAGFALRLDGRPVRTPAGAPLAIESARLAEAIAEEWRAQGERIDPISMPLTGLANAAIDRVAPDPAGFAASLARYGESDLVCYRAEGPAPLVARQAEAWDPFVAWARRRYDAQLKVTMGVVHVAQPASTVERLARAAAARSHFALAGLSPLVTISGSLVIALAVAEGEVTAEQAWDAASVDERWQSDQWGEDQEAAASLAARRAAFAAAARFLMLL